MKLKDDNSNTIYMSVERAYKKKVLTFFFGFFR